MHILLTRQLQDSKDLIQKFKSNGFKVSNLPLLEINKLDYKFQAQWVFEMANYYPFLYSKKYRRNLNLISAPVDLPIQFLCIVFTFSGQRVNLSKSFKSSSA